MVEQYRVAPERLRRRVDPAALGFVSTAEVDALEDSVGQQRAMDALRFGVGMETPGYNVFITGLSGSGRTGMARQYLSQAATALPVPDDWVYVHDFEQIDRPNAIRLPAGRGRRLEADMETFVSDARREITHAFETERYAERRRQLAHDFAGRRDPLIEQLAAFARERGFAIETSPGGIMAVPVSGGRPLTSEQVAAMTDQDRSELERKGADVQAQIATVIRRVAQLEREGAEELVKLDRDIARFALEPVLHGLREKYGTEPGVISFLEQVAADIPNHLADFRQAPSDGPAEASSPLEAALSSDHTNRYRVNVLVDNSSLEGAPVMVEANPTYYNLIGRIEYRATFGTMVTDFRQVKAGALHRANGGFLILNGEDVLTNPFAWPALVRALSTQQLRIENLGEQFSAIPTASLAPEAIPLRVKVVLVGSPALYQLLYHLDEEFRELFKVRVDFAPEIDWDDASVGMFAAFVRRCIDARSLKHFDPAAVARVIEEAARWRESQRKLSTRLRDVDDLVAEASYWASEGAHEVVRAEDVARAVREKERRSSLTEERLRELIVDGTLRVEVEGRRTGQLNGLSVIELGDHRFGVPARLSASVAIGRGTVDSIERETRLGGPIHNKGFLIVSGYLASQYAQTTPLALRATLTFEQSYDEIEGDSASSTELYALLSALAEVPLSQSIAVTGSVDQHGSVQAVGGVTDKIEGFFKVCRARGLTGEQGVVIPTANVQNLMLSEDVVEAVRAGTFHVWAVDTIDQGIEILTGRAAGARGGDGSYPPETIHGLVARKLERYARLQAQYGTGPDGERPHAALADAHAPDAGQG